MTDKEYYLIIKKMFLDDDKTVKEICLELKENFNIDKTESSIRHYIQRHNLIKFHKKESMLTLEIKEKILELYHMNYVYYI